MYDFPYVLPQLPGPSLTTHGTVAPASSCNGLAGIRGDSTYVQPYLLTSRYGPPFKDDDFRPPTLDLTALRNTSSLKTAGKLYAHRL